MGFSGSACNQLRSSDLTHWSKTMDSNMFTSIILSVYGIWIASCRFHLFGTLTMIAIGVSIQSLSYTLCCDILLQPRLVDRSDNQTRQVRDKHSASSFPYSWCSPLSSRRASRKTRCPLPSLFIKSEIECETGRALPSDINTSKPNPRRGRKMVLTVWSLVRCCSRLAWWLRFTIQFKLFATK